jgi:hypothetical protein
MFALEGQLLEAVRTAFAEHDRDCQQHAYLILLNPANYELLGWDEVLGLPVLPDTRVEPMTARIVCCASKDATTPKWAGQWDGDVVWWVNEEPHIEIAPAEARSESA